MVAANVDLGRKPGEDPTAVVVDGTRLAVDENLGLADLAAERLDNCLVSEAHPQRGGGRPEGEDQFDRAACA